MKQMIPSRLFIALLAGVGWLDALAQPPSLPPGLRMGDPEALFGAPPVDLPDEPTAVSLPRFTAKAGPGPMYDSAPAQWPGRDMARYGYVADEYVVSGTANGEPYTTRLVIRRPSDNADSSGLVVAESMHPIGAAHGFEYNSIYIMGSGHIAAEIATVGIEALTRFNGPRYADIRVSSGQGSEILAQVGALIRSPEGPLAGLAVRKMILWGTSATSRILTNYLPAHAVLRTPDMQRIYDGFLPTSNGSQIDPVDVPMIQVPTQHEYGLVATSQQDGDEPGSQFRVYEFAGMAHLDARNNGARFGQDDCVYQLTTFPLEAYMSVALHHLLRWVDEGVTPPRADRVLIDRNVDNDGSLMALDEYGNPRGGIRNPYVDVPVAKYTMRNRPTTSPSPGEGFQAGPSLLCFLSGWETRFSKETLRDLYGSKRAYVNQVRERLARLEADGWSLPVYQDLILADAEAVEF